MPNHQPTELCRWKHILIQHVEANAFGDRSTGLLRTQKSEKGKHEDCWREETWWPHFQANSAGKLHRCNHSVGFYRCVKAHNLSISYLNFFADILTGVGKMFLPQDGKDKTQALCLQWQTNDFSGVGTSHPHPYFSLNCLKQGYISIKISKTMT